jgi:hypothetical protein
MIKRLIISAHIKWLRWREGHAQEDALMLLKAMLAVSDQRANLKAYAAGLRARITELEQQL